MGFGMEGDLDLNTVYPTFVQPLTPFKSLCLHPLLCRIVCVGGEDMGVSVGMCSLL